MAAKKNKGKYVDGFVLCIPKKKINEYKKIASKACKIWLDHGALDYIECVGQDLRIPFGIPFPKLTKSKPSETVVFAWIVYKSKAHRDQVNANVMADPRIAKMDPTTMPFDCNKMTYGGFEVLVSA